MAIAKIQSTLDMGNTTFQSGALIGNQSKERDGILMEKIKLKELIADEKQEEESRRQLLNSCEAQIEDKCNSLTPFRLHDFGFTKGAGGWRSQADSKLIQIILLREIAYKNLVNGWQSAATNNRKTKFLLFQIQKMQDYGFYEKIQTTMKRAEKILSREDFVKVFLSYPKKCKQCGDFLIAVEGSVKNKDGGSNKITEDVCFNCERKFEK